MSQERLAQLCGLDRTYVSGVERGLRNPTIQAVFRLSVVLCQNPADQMSMVVEKMTEDGTWFEEAMDRGSVDAS